MRENEELISYLLVGRFDDGRIHLQELNESAPQTPDAETTAVFDYLIRKAGAKFVGTIRVRMENEPTAYHSFINDPPTSQEETAMLNAVAIVMATGRGRLEENTRECFAELAHKVQVLDALGLGVGEGTANGC